MPPKRNFATQTTTRGFKNTQTNHGKNFKNKIIRTSPTIIKTTTTTITTATTTTKKEKGGIKIKIKTKGKVGAKDLRRIPQIKKNNPKGPAARLPFFLDNWAKVCSNNFILRIVAEGYKLQFVSEPSQNYFEPRVMSIISEDICKLKVKEFLSQGAIIKVPASSCSYFSNIFPVPKKSVGEFRIIFDLSDLNTHLRKIHFKMDNLSSVISLISPGDWLVSIDLSDAYHSVAMHLLSMPYLAFIFMSTCYQFTCLPQGLSPSPRIFTMLMRVVLRFLRSLSVKIAAWIDDFILAANSASLVSDHASLTLRTFKDLGFLPNIEKSHLKPVQRLCHLGLIWDTINYDISVPPDKVADIQEKCRRVLSSRVSIRFLSSILGSIEFFRWGFPYAAIHYRSLQRCVISLLKRGFSYDSVVSCPRSANVDLEWWASCSLSLPSRSLYSFSPDLILYSDSSNSGWGGWSSQGESTYGFWSKYESTLHINIREMKAVLFLFQCFYRQTSDCSILIKTDNTSVVAYINNQGGTCSARLCVLALKLWSFCICRNIKIHALHVPGIENSKADALSRMSTNDHSYSLSQDIFLSIQSKLSFCLSIDCFASRLNYKLPSFISWHYDPLSCSVNAFTENWSKNVYLFPPLPLINRVLSKFISDNVNQGLLITPFWPSSPWFSSLLNILIESPFILPPGCVSNEDSLLPRFCRFLAWPIGCDPQLQQDFQRTLPKLSSEVLKEKPFVCIKDIGDGSACGVVRGRLVTVRLP